MRVSRSCDIQFPDLPGRDTARAMSQENMEVVRQMLDAFNRGDFEASLTFLDRDVEWHDPSHVPGAGVHRGPEEVRRWFLRWLGAWETYTAEAEELIDAGDHVVVVHHERGIGKGSGAEVENRSANLFDALAVRIGTRKREAVRLLRRQVLSHAQGMRSLSPSFRQ